VLRSLLSSNSILCNKTKSLITLKLYIFLYALSMVLCIYIDELNELSILNKLYLIL
jgi:hypothetical protein